MNLVKLIKQLICFKFKFRIAYFFVDYESIFNLFKSNIFKILSKLKKLVE